ncbi:MAG: Trk family potassium uptake protein [Erysipelotrichaceae bacterium]|nr:Trk family potassium uptake protein [Erysipelotrichaceae bacterium]
MKKKLPLNPYALVLISFVLIILIGSLLLIMPWAQSTGKWAWNNYFEALFTATSATCVTGFDIYPSGISGQLSLGGQIVVLAMIQLGGLGFITVLAFFITLFKSKLQFKERYLLSQAVNSTNFADVVSFVRKIIVISLSVELIGALIGLPVFFTMFPGKPGQAIWNSIFLSVSAFNNAGFDVNGNTSLIPDAGTLIANLPNWATIYLNIYVMLLIVAGGISFLVIIEVFSFKKKPKQWRVFTKIVLLTTAFLIIAGFVWFLLAECFKGSGSMNPLDALFQSITSRTAGFATYNQNDLTIGSKIVTSVLMFIGGSPLSTAGGIKTTTLFMICLAIYSYLRGKSVSAFKRTYSTKMIVKALALFFIAILAVIVCFIIISTIESGKNIPSENILFEIMSSFGTVGLSTGAVDNLSVASNSILILLMFAGRLGPITFFQVFQMNMNKQGTTHHKLVEEDFLIG